jgi:predicted nuclease of predicted toxin-antitoxin system
VIRLLADENFNNNIVRGVRLRESGIDLVRIQDVGLSGADDPSVLEWAAEHQRILLTHDVNKLGVRFSFRFSLLGIRVAIGRSFPRLDPVGRYHFMLWTFSSTVN